MHWELGFSAMAHTHRHQTHIGDIRLNWPKEPIQRKWTSPLNHLNITFDSPKFKSNKIIKGFFCYQLFCEETKTINEFLSKISGAVFPDNKKVHQKVQYLGSHDQQAQGRGGIS